MTEIKKTSVVKKMIWTGLALLTLSAIAVYFIFTQKFDDTNEQVAAYTVNSMTFIKEFQENNALANETYAEKIITVNGTVSEKEMADSTINIKMIDTLTNAYIIFAFQQQHLADAGKLAVGDNVSIKGSCSGGTYSDILETYMISFKRCALNK